MNILQIMLLVLSATALLYQILAFVQILGKVANAGAVIITDGLRIALFAGMMVHVGFILSLTGISYNLA